jgi:guanylate kinase
MTGDSIPKLAAPAFVLVVSGPSGVGKNAVCERLVRADPALVPSVSATTRPPRPGETSGRHYHFWPESRFRSEIAAGRFLEWAEVHGQLYGTPREFLEAARERGQCPVLNIDVQGGASVKRLLPEAVLVFLFPPSLEALAARLRGRGTEDEAETRRRLRVAEEEMRRWTEYDYALVNDDLERAVSRVAAIVEAERARVARIATGPPPGSV